jgi:hypothetical protein
VEQCALVTVKDAICFMENEIGQQRGCLLVGRVKVHAPQMGR